MSDQHPLTETAAAELWDTHAGDTVPWEDWYGGSRRALTSLLRAAFNAGREHERTTPEDDRPWEPLGESDQVCVGDEVKWDYYGLAMTATVARVDKTGSLYTAAGLHIGVRSVGTWHVRRAVRELPTEGGIVIVANDGHDDIEAIGPVSGATWRTKEAVLGADGRWYGVWRLDARTPAAASAAPEHITLDTCKVDDR